MPCWADLRQLGQRPDERRKLHASLVLQAACSTLQNMQIRNPHLVWTKSYFSCLQDLHSDSSCSTGGSSQAHLRSHLAIPESEWICIRILLNHWRLIPIEPEITPCGGQESDSRKRIIIPSSWEYIWIEIYLFSNAFSTIFIENLILMQSEGYEYFDVVWRVRVMAAVASRIRRISASVFTKFVSARATSIFSLPWSANTTTKFFTFNFIHLFMTRALVWGQCPSSSAAASQTHPGSKVCGSDKYKSEEDRNFRCQL